MKNSSSERGVAYYREVQRFSQIWIWILILAVSTLAWIAAVQQLLLKKPFGNHPAPDSLLIVIWGFFGVGFPVFFCALKMETEVGMDGIYVRFVPIHRSFQKFPFSEIVHYEVQKYRPLQDYGGWGIRQGPKGKAYNVKGNRGLLLKLKDNQSLMIGSRNPEKMITVLDSVFPQKS